MPRMLLSTLKLAAVAAVSALMLSACVVPPPGPGPAPMVLAPVPPPPIPLVPIVPLIPPPMGVPMAP